MQYATACLVLSLCASVTCATPWPTHHPRITFDADRSTAKPFLGKTESQLEQMYRDEPYRFAIPKFAFERPLENVVGLWKQSGDETYRDLAIAACRASLVDWLDVDDASLRNRINADGPRDEMNLAARDASYHFALLYHLTGDVVHAGKAEVLLARFAESMADWKIYRTHYNVDYLKDAYDQDWPEFSEKWDVTGLWGTWIYMDLYASEHLAKAYDLIHDAGVMQERGSLAAVEDMLRRHMRLQMRYGRKLHNMDATQMRSLLLFAYVLGEPQWVHYCEDWIRDLYQTMFYADGWWHEGAFSYHKQIHQGLIAVMDEWLTGYSDPPGFVAADGTRFDNYQPGLSLRRSMERADYVMATCIQPNGIAQVIHDTTYKHNVWWAEPLTEASSHLYGSMGHAILGAGAGDDMMQATLHFGGSHGHAHFDTLNLILFAKGHELISETRYREIPDSGSTRPWQQSTAGHITVVIDERDQNTPDFRRGIQLRERQPEDAIEGVPDSLYRWAGHGNSMNDGELRLFNTDFDMVQIIEADGERAYDPMPEMYRRTIALVKIDERDAYVVDIFRVKGGEKHDYMLHGCLDEPYTAELSINASEPMDGVLHEYIRDLHTVRTDDTWHVTMRLDSGLAATRTWMLSQQGTQIIQGVAPAMRRVGDAPFLAVRQGDGESIFVAVHHPFTDEPIVQAVELIKATDDRVALRVILPDGEDVVSSTAAGFAHTRSGQWQYEVAGSHAITGVIKRTHRIEAGDDIDAFVTDTVLPTDGSLDGFALMIDQAGVLVRSVIIDRVERRDDETFILTRDEPGMHITDGLIKQTHYPGWGINGQATFRIGASSLVRE
jgi:hypothetical protein